MRIRLQHCYIQTKTILKNVTFTLSLWVNILRHSSESRNPSGRRYAPHWVPVSSTGMTEGGGAVD